MRNKLATLALVGALGFGGVGCGGEQVKNNPDKTIVQADSLGEKKFLHLQGFVSNLRFNPSENSAIARVKLTFDYDEFESDHDYLIDSLDMNGVHVDKEKSVNLRLDYKDFKNEIASLFPLNVGDKIDFNLMRGFVQRGSITPPWIDLYILRNPRDTLPARINWYDKTKR